MKINMTKRFQ